MKGAVLTFREDQRQLELMLLPDIFEPQNTLEHMRQFIEFSEHHNLFCFDDKITELIEQCNVARLAKQLDPISGAIGEARDYTCSITIVEDNMAAFVDVITPYGGRYPTKDEITELLKRHGVVRGISAKQINFLVTKLPTLKAGEKFNHVVARGLPAKDGKDSYLKPLVPNALERVLRPKVTDNDIADMRDLGDIITVKENTPLLERVPPTAGRAGYDIFDTELEAKAGKYLEMKPGVGTIISPENPNLLLASINGMPKFKNNSMWVDDVFICKGVNVSTGNIRYDGAVLVNGDVAEKMKIICSGDVTINGFVESAHIEAGGDIIITQGAMGKVDDAQKEYSSDLNAEGNIHIQHGQGLRIRCNGNLTVAKQLAYSDIVVGGGITIGKLDKPNGNLFACKIVCQQSVKAGTLGAVSGSQLSIDFSGGYNQIIEFQSSIDSIFTSLGKNLSDHLETINAINTKRIPEEIRPKANLAQDIYDSEVRLYSFLQKKVNVLKDKKATFISDIGLEASKVLYPGVSVKLNNRTWRAEKEYSCARIHYTDYQWQFDPLN